MKENEAKNKKRNEWKGGIVWSIISLHPNI